MAADGGSIIFSDIFVRGQSSIHRSQLSVDAQPSRILFFPFFSRSGCILMLPIVYIAYKEINGSKIKSNISFVCECIGAANVAAIVVVAIHFFFHFRLKHVDCVTFDVLSLTFPYSCKSFFYFSFGRISIRREWRR